LFLIVGAYNIRYVLVKQGYFYGALEASCGFMQVL
jgi:hypothetical protein